MYPELKKAVVLRPYVIELSYSNNEKRILDVEIYCNSEFFKQLLDWQYFKQVYIENGVLTWHKGHDIASETVYLDSFPVTCPFRVT